MVVGLVGSAVEFADFVVYGTAATLVFPALFFSGFGATGSVALAMLSYAVGFLDRPLGAYLARRLDNRTALVTSSLTVGVSTVAIGLLPAGATIPLVLLRIAQGLGLGGEWPRTTASMVTGKGIGIAQLGAPVGVLLGNAGFALALAVAPGDAFVAWGWRLPFLLSGLLVLALLGVRLRAVTPSQPRHGGSVLTVCRLHWRRLLVAITVRTGSDVAFYVLALFVLGYVTRHLGLPASVGFTAVLAGAACQIAAVPLFGALPEPRRVILAGAAASAVWVFVSFALFDTRVPALIVLATVVGAVLNAAMWSPAASFVPRLFPPAVREAGTGLGFQLSAVTGGAVAPLVSTLLVAGFGSGLPVACYVAAMLLAGITATLVYGR